MLSSPLHLDTATQLQNLHGPQTSLRKMSLSSTPKSTSSNNTNSSVIFDDDISELDIQRTNAASAENMALAQTLRMPYVPDQIFIGGRKSVLAVAQSQIVKGLIKRTFTNMACPILALTTLGDHVQNKPLYSFGGKALWTKELEILLLQDLGEYHKLDLVVHSLKDMPTNLPEEFELGCIVKREDPSDAVVMSKNSPYTRLEDLPAGSVVGTSSVRRSAQLKRNLPHLVFESVRGNLQTRIKKLDDPTTPFACIILATAGLVRVGLDHRITQRLDEKLMYHAVGQGALGIEIRKGDTIMKTILSTIEDKNSTVCCYAERALMRTLEGGCSVPIGVATKYDETTSILTLKGLVVSVDGQNCIEDQITVQIGEDFKFDADMAGQQLAEQMKLKGAKEILDEIDFNKINEKDE